MKKHYVCWMSMENGIKNDTFNIEGKVNHFTIMKAINDSFDKFSENGCKYVISWSEEDVFTFEEVTEFWENYGK